MTMSTTVLNLEVLTLISNPIQILPIRWGSTGQRSQKNLIIRSSRDTVSSGSYTRLSPFPPLCTLRFCHTKEYVTRRNLCGAQPPLTTSLRIQIQLLIISEAKSSKTFNISVLCFQKNVLSQIQQIRGQVLSQLVHAVQK